MPITSWLVRTLVELLTTDTGGSGDPYTILVTLPYWKGIARFFGSLAPVRFTVEGL
ncbi:hypothetical protein [Streptomyces jumonjinensis]|uniref:hypothetical protein n=1 Tax=Streptomyces jumonjinensis TaxID=1945 RepID=UPI001297067B|nr:hypothetical protein [Streptomyces jumonjinensis]